MTHVQQIAIGERLYLFTADDAQGNRPRRLIITSHGGYHERAVGNRLPNGWTRVPSWTTLYFYAQHGYILKDPGTRELLGHRPAQVGSAGEEVPNYVLSKFQETGGDAGVETYDSIKQGIVTTHEFLQLQKDGLAEHGLDLDTATDPEDTEQRITEIEANATGAQKMMITVQKGKRQVELYDVLTVRKRRLKWDMTLREVLVELDRAGYRYPEIHCSFCRSPIRIFPFDRRIPKMDAADEPRWARSGNFVRKP
ncbi:MAG: hypothetical protein QM820_24575 [Minicystis sp.]